MTDGASNASENKSAESKPNTVDGSKNNNSESEVISNLKAALHEERQGKKALKEQLDKVQSDTLAEQNRYKELYEKLKPEHEALSAQLTSLNSFFEKAVVDAKAKAPKEVLDLLPNNLNPQDQVSWITKATEAFGNKNSGGPRRLGVEIGGISNPQNKPGVGTTIDPEQYANLPREERMKYLDDMVKYHNERTSNR